MPKNLPDHWCAHNFLNICGLFSAPLCGLTQLSSFLVGTCAGMFIQLTTAIYSVHMFAVVTGIRTSSVGLEIWIGWDLHFCTSTLMEIRDCSHRGEQNSGDASKSSVQRLFLSSSGELKSVICPFKSWWVASVSWIQLASSSKPGMRSKPKGTGRLGESICWSSLHIGLKFLSPFHTLVGSRSLTMSVYPDLHYLAFLDIYCLKFSTWIDWSRSSDKYFAVFSIIFCAPLMLSRMCVT